MPERPPRWPFPPTDGGPDSRPLFVDLDNVLVVIVRDDEAAERSATRLRQVGFAEDRLRSYSSAEMLANDAAFRSGRGMTNRVVGAIVDDGGAMASYVAYARGGRAALWVLVDGREDANRVIRQLVDDVIFVWFHSARGVETLGVQPPGE